MNSKDREIQRLFFSNLSFYLWRGMDGCPFVNSREIKGPRDYTRALESMYESARMVCAERRWWMRWLVVPAYDLCLRVWR